MAKQFTVGNAVYGERRVLIIAEPGSSRGADPVKARELIDAAAEAGADCIKTQIIYADEILRPNTGEVPLPGGPRRLYNTFRDLEAPLPSTPASGTMRNPGGSSSSVPPLGREVPRNLRP